MMRYIIAALIVLASVVMVSAEWPREPFRTAPAPAQTAPAQINLKGLRASVTVGYDQRGIPYVDARNDEDLYFAQGYVVARDRLWQMDLTRRVGRGQLAELFGRSVIEQDKIHRIYGFGQLAEQMLARLGPKAKAAILAYTQGVNAYLESLDEKTLPVECRILRYKPAPWTPADCLVVGKVFAENLSTSWQIDLVRAAFAGVPEEKRDQIFPTKSSLDVLLVGRDEVNGAGKAAGQSQSAASAPSRAVLDESLRILVAERESLERIGLYAESMAASNNWVVSGSRTVTGKPLLANDPHLSPAAPGIWYMMSLNAPGLHCAGVTVAGAPGIFIGHNDYVAWGITNVQADVQDLFLEKFDDSQPNRYQTPDGWREAEVRHEEIRVRKVPTDPATQPEGFDVTVTRHGPIILDKDKKRYALAWPALDPTTREMEAFYEINRARNCKELEAALGHYTGFPLNFVYADVNGHIGWWAQGRYPLRKTGHGNVPQEGWTTAGEWTGYIPAADTPHLYDPPSGIIVTANSRIIGTSYPYYIGGIWDAPYRSRRIFELLSAGPKLSVGDFQKIQGDTYSTPGTIFAGEVMKMAKPLASGSADWAVLLKALEGWDGRTNAASKEVLLVTRMRSAFAAQLIRSAFGPDLAKQYRWPSEIFFDRIIQEQPKEWLPKEYSSYQDFIIACYKEARETIQKRLGPDESTWSWGSWAKVRFPHPLAGAPFVGGQFVIQPFAQNGSGYTVNTGSPVSMRLVADLSNWDNTRQGIPLGESGDPKSPHWSDQLEDWRNVTPAVFPFSQKAVREATREEVRLGPAH